MIKVTGAAEGVNSVTVRNIWLDAVTKSLDQVDFRHLPFAAILLYEKIGNISRDIPKMSERNKAAMPCERPYWEQSCRYRLWSSRAQKILQ